jgi:hypothetical protein
MPWVVGIDDVGQVLPLTDALGKGAAQSSVKPEKNSKNHWEIATVSRRFMLHTCPQMTRHLSTALRRYGYKLLRTLCVVKDVDRVSTELRSMVTGMRQSFVMIFPRERGTCPIGARISRPPKLRRINNYV